jgi:hypothetical protein
MNAEEYKGLFSASMAVLNLGASYFLMRSKKLDPNILYLINWHHLIVYISYCSTAIEW